MPCAANAEVETNAVKLVELMHISFSLLKNPLLILKNNRDTKILNRVFRINQLKDIEI